MDRVIAILVVFLAFTSGLALVHGDSTLSTDEIRTSISYAVFLVSLVIFGLCVVTRKVDISIAVIVPIVYALVSYFDFYEDRSFNVISWFRVLLVFLLIPSVRVKVVKYYRIVLIAMSLLGFLGVILYYLNYSELYRVVDYYGVIGGEYIDFGFTYLYLKDCEIR